MLRARTVPAGTTIIRKGGRGDAMYFIASGSVEVESSNDKVVLQEGDFFGEVALLSREPRSATVTALRSTDLLVLEADDFIRLVDQLPDVGEKVRAVANERRISPHQLTANRLCASEAATGDFDRQLCVSYVGNSPARRSPLHLFRPRFLPVSCVVARISVST